VYWPTVVETVTLTAPAISEEGVRAVRLVAELQIIFVADAPPMVNPVFPGTKLVPVTKIEVPPTVDPEFGEIISIVGGNWAKAEVEVSETKATARITKS